ncbi:bacillithiol system redox-active protein YtxJ [Sediminibacillus massiliensis]|uniref:bacillithiol system redox-active protein YtxJ n=1 Tax=Sediminibacillus massiliensis TaxID=1926277 RepID=UPI003CCBDBC2
MEALVIQTKEEFEQVKNQYESFILMKHSLTCPISAEAKREFELFSEEATDVPLFVLYVQKARELSNHIAETYDVKHESPQVLVFKNNQVVWNESHGNITKKNLLQQIE